MVKRSHKDAQKTRAKILDVAADMLLAEGPRMTLARIAAAAGVSRGAIYGHFPRREALMQELVDIASRKACLRAETEAATQDSAHRDRMHTLIAAALSQLPLQAVLDVVSSTKRPDIGGMTRGKLGDVHGSGASCDFSGVPPSRDKGGQVEVAAAFLTDVLVLGLSEKMQLVPWEEWMQDPIARVVQAFMAAIQPCTKGQDSVQINTQRNDRAEPVWP